MPYYPPKAANCTPAFECIRYNLFGVALLYDELEHDGSGYVIFHFAGMHVLSIPV